MPLDTFICGTCQGTFTDLSEFVSHKQRPCSSDGRTGSTPEAGPGSQDAELIQLHLNESGEITGMTAQGMEEEEGKGPDSSALAFLNNVDMGAELANVALDGKDGTNARTAHLIILNSPLNGESENGDGSITLLNNVNFEGLTGGHLVSPQTNDTNTHQVSNSNAEQAQARVNQQGPDQLPKKRRGRARASENRPKPLEAVPPTTQKPSIPERDADGKLVCPQCKRLFAKERHFNTHKCLASSSYVDITKKEVKIDSGDEYGEDGDLGLDSAGNDDDEDFTAVHETGTEKEELEDEKEMEKEDDFVSRRKRRGRKRKRSSYQFEVDVHVENEGAKQMKMAAESMRNLPIFKNDEEKIQFEACVDVDLSQVDNMFRIHIIEQELNEMSGMVYNTPTMSSLSVYSCNVCEKVFKSLSHIRLHCVTHTDIKPFKCTKCSYATNSKGNLYTHMRKHTGQFYRCDQCDFKTVNKSHLVEHQMIHTNRRAQCLLCQKDYSTLKSLINHVRKYHTDKKGKDYLQTFLQGRGAKGTTVIHQCHICNRKFKKRIDRDRHLFIHDIKDLPHVQQCELCDYWASRRVYLDKHYLKHRVIYCCTLCDEKFLSSVRLRKHLTEKHSEQGGPDKLLTDCINRSLYLPEPLTTSHEGSKYVNLPPELRETSTQETESQENNVKCKVSSSSTVLEKLEASTVGASPSEEQTLQDQQLPLKSDPNVASAMISSSPPGNNSGDVKAIYTETDQLGPEKGTAGQVLDTGIKDMEDQDIRVNEKVENPGCDLSDPVKLTLGEFGESSQENKMDLMMMLQNPGSDSDQDGEGQKEDTQDVKTVLGEKKEETKSAKSDTKIYEDVSGSPQAHDITLEESIMNESNDSPSKNSDENCNATSGDTEGKPTASSNPTEQTSVTVSNDENREKKIQALIQRLGYRKMTSEIFKKMRDTFGHEECEFCGRLFYSKADYEPHLRTHTGDKPFACANCSFRGNTKEQLRKHCESEHEKVAFQCKECDFLAPTRSRLWNHQLKHLGINGLSCPECPSKFDGMKQLRAHIINCHKDMDKDVLEKLTGYRHKSLGKMGRRSFKCPHCPRVFIRANSELQKHIWIHEGIKPYTCPICPYACRSKNNLQAHMLRHSAEKPFSCSECGKEYKSKTALRWHVRSHKTGKLFKCDRCSYEATQASHLKRHMETHEVLKRFICKHCDYSANTLGYMKIHYAKHHKGQAFSHEEIVDPESSMPDKRVYKCLSCGYLFGNLSDLKRHLKIRHHVLMQDIADMDQMQVSEVEVMQYEDQSTLVASTTDIVSNQQSHSQTQLPSSHAAGGEIQFQMQGSDGAQSFSAASLIQHIMGLSQLGNSQVRVVSEDGQPIDIAPETIVVRQDGQVLLSGDGNSILPGNQFIIQYLNPEEVNEPTNASDNPNLEVQLEPKDPSHQQQQQQRLQPQHQQETQPNPSGQYIINNSPGTQVIIQEGASVAGQIVTVDSQGHLIQATSDKANEVHFLSNNSETSGIVELDSEEDYTDRMVITEDQGDSLVIGESGSSGETVQ
ncbi:hypothetical protein RRG08_000162 [Elysia crispata]|uniref:C2H2-type domain-containing protein n=1 Tax=Elysia crispata TaxID=231223 RepID=A0AAE1D5K9_9GAST|nr:hypothetical protein RRG08_000162 [Elysia crispata]